MISEIFLFLCIIINVFLEVIFISLIFSTNSLSIISSQFRFNLDGEGGEFETIVVDAPHMKQRIDVSGHPEWKGNRGIWVIDSAKLS